MVFLPPIALYIVWKDKKFFKQMSLVIFYSLIFRVLWVAWTAYTSEDMFEILTSSETLIDHPAPYRL